MCDEHGLSVDDRQHRAGRGEHRGAAAHLERLTSGFDELRLMSVAVDEAVARLAEISAPAAVLIDTSDIASEHLSLLADLIAACDRDGLRVIVMLTVDQLDAVGGLLLGSDAVLLCDANDAELAAKWRPH